MTRVIGIDVGGTKVAASTLTREHVGDTIEWRTEHKSSDLLTDQLVKLVNRAAVGRPYCGVGIGVPSVVRFQTGEAVSSINVPLTGVPLRAVLSRRLGKPVFVDNDANVAAFAEAHDTALNLTTRNLVMFTVGTGTGGGIVLDGRIFRGGSGGAGEFGHTLICLKTEPDIQASGNEFPQPGSLERLASWQALDQFARAVVTTRPESLLAAAHASRGPVHGADAIDAARSGDPAAAAIVRQWAQALGIGVANAINTFDPDDVVIGGGGIAAGAMLLEPAVEIASGYVHPGLRDRINVRLAHWGSAAGVVGAGLLALNELERAQIARGFGQGV